MSAARFLRIGPDAEPLLSCCSQLAAVQYLASCRSEVCSAKLNRALLLHRYLVIKRSWPSGMRTLSGDHARFEATYFNLYPGCALLCRRRVPSMTEARLSELVHALKGSY